MPQHDDWQAYVNDPRTICKYGAKCYQKNPEHHSSYKHPPTNINVTKAREKRKFSPYSREKKNTIVKTDDNNKIKNDLTSVKLQNSVVENNASTSDSPSDEKVKVNIPDIIKYYDKNLDHGFFKEIFLVDMPEDFYRFLECFDEDKVEKMLSNVNLELIGPYDLLLGKLPIINEKELYLVHWRFFYDPPEFQAVLKKKGTSEFHIGYYRDAPNEKPVFLASNDSVKDSRLTPLANNIFAAVYFYLENEQNSSPFMAMACKKLMDKLKKTAEKNSFSIEKYNIKERQSKIVAKTLHGAGIVVPYNQKTQLGYRHLTETDANLKKIFAKLEKATNPEEKDKVLSELQPVITYANIAVDECDFGTGLEAGIDLFCSGLKELEPSALSCLTSAYNLLNRQAFSKIISAHLKYRRKGAKLSILDFK